MDCGFILHVPGFNLKSLFRLRKRWSQLWEYWVSLQSTLRRLRSFIIFSHFFIKDIPCFSKKASYCWQPKLASTVTQFDIFKIASKIMKFLFLVQISLNLQLKFVFMLNADMCYMQANTWCLHPMLQVLHVLPRHVCIKSWISHGGWILHILYLIFL